MPVPARHPPPCHRADHVAVVPLLAAALLAVAAGRPLAAQAVQPTVQPTVPAPDSLARWEVHAEIAAVHGGTWADGGSAPTVRAGGGALFGVQIVRELDPGRRARSARRRTWAGAAARVHAQLVTVREHGERWDGGTLTKGDLIGVLSWRSHPGTAVRLGIDAGAGVAYVSASDRIAPFAGASSFAPTAEFGLVLSPGGASMEGRPYAMFARVSALRFAPPPTEGDVVEGASAGFVTQLAVGLRVGR